MGMFSWLFKCNHKQMTTVYSIEYTGDVQWTRSETVNAFLTNHTTVKPIGRKYLTIEKCSKCGQCLIGLSTSQGYAPFDIGYVHALFKSETGKSAEEILEGIRNDQVG